MKLAKQVALGAVVLFAAVALEAWQYGQPSSAPPLFGGGRGTTAPEKTKKGPQLRSLVGTVLSQHDTAVPHAVVYLKNLKTATIKTYIANDEGAFQFNGLSPNIDYEFYAELDGQKSSTKMLSSFDSRQKATINLHIEVKKAEQESKKDEHK